MKKVVFVFLWVVSCYAMAQESSTISTDRPSQSAASSLVPKGSIQIETGLIKENAGNSEGYNFNTLLRWGITEHFEFRFQQDYLSVKTGDKRNKGLSPTRLGFKSFVTKEKGWIPEVAFIGHITLASGESNFKTDNITPDFRFAVSKTLSDQFYIGYNLGMQWDHNTPRSTTFYTLIIGGVLGEKFGWFIEPYGFIRKGESASSLINGGLVFLLKPNMQVDVSGGFGITKKAADNFFSIGYSARF